MSRRFGRNQRRRAREALAVEVQRVEQTAKLAAHRLQMYSNCNRELDNLREFFATVATRVGRESILVGGEVEAHLDSHATREFRAFVRPEFEYRTSSAAPDTMECVKYEIMRRLQVKAVRDVFARQIVVRCLIGNAEVGIALSDSLLARSTEQEISHRIAQELARSLAKAIKASLQK